MVTNADRLIEAGFVRCPNERDRWYAGGPNVKEPALGFDLFATDTYVSLDVIPYGKVNRDDAVTVFIFTDADDCLGFLAKHGIAHSRPLHHHPRKLTEGTMASHPIERDRFMATMEAEGMPREISRRILRHAQTIQRCAELECSSEAADRDQVKCPARRGDACLCRDYGSYRQETTDTGWPKDWRNHGTIPRYAVTSARAERLVREWCETASEGRHPHFVPIFSGDPRGACVKIRVPSGRNDSWGGEGAICVPTR